MASLFVCFIFCIVVLHYCVRIVCVVVTKIRCEKSLSTISDSLAYIAWLGVVDIIL